MINKKAELKKITDTGRRYSFLWSRYTNILPPKEYHFNSMQEVIPEKIVRGSIGLDLGCGCGWDIFVMAKENPSVRIIGIDISDGVYNALKLCREFNNVNILKASTTDLPLKREFYDFVYSFGVLHHVPDYKRGLLEVNRVLKKDSPCFLYLYEKHTHNPVKYIGIKIVSLVRKITVKISPRILYVLSYMASPIFIILFSYPANFFKRFKSLRWLYEKMPFNFGNGLFSLSGDIYDRFGAPVEYRFSKEDIFNIFFECSFYRVNITKLKDTAGWVVWGYKKRES